MANEYLNGDAAKMNDIGGQFDPPPATTAEPLRREPLRCSDSGILECRELFLADSNSTNTLQTYVTHLMQGFAAFKEMTVASGLCYADGDGMAAREFEAIVNRRDLNLTDRAGIFEPRGDRR
ncbi:MAG TPA: hypothetical protein VFG15_13885 [Amycolatopsis sp.]|nr:hypothetical protein [Amycolatopsis sp.]